MNKTKSSKEPFRSMACPWCGGFAHLHEWHFGAFVLCRECGARGPQVSDVAPGMSYASRAWGLWNNRIQKPQPNSMFSEKDVERIATVTNHVSEGMGRLCTRNELYEAVRYWGMEASLLASEAQIVKTRALIDAALGKLKSINKPMKLKWKDETTYRQDLESDDPKALDWAIRKTIGTKIPIRISFFDEGYIRILAIQAIPNRQWVTIKIRDFLR